MSNCQYLYNKVAIGIILFIFSVVTAVPVFSQDRKESTLPPKIQAVLSVAKDNLYKEIDERIDQQLNEVLPQ